MPQTESTGNPMRDLELQRMATARRFDRDEQPHSNDEYAGLMSQRERQWIINIQLSQLKCENPFLVNNYYKHCYHFNHPRYKGFFFKVRS
jgi:hypothetical protein